jgi:flagellar protein FliL
MSKPPSDAKSAPASAKGAKPLDPEEETPEAAEAAPAPRKSRLASRRNLLLMAIPLLLAIGGAGLWFGGILRPLLGFAKKPAAVASAEAKPGAATKEQGKAGPPATVDIPEIVANLNVGPRRNSYIKLHARLELARAEDDATLKVGMPRLLDLFQTYLREMRPEELRGSEGTYRLREELLARANIALAPARVTDVLFTEMLIQ